MIGKARLALGGAAGALGAAAGALVLAGGAAAAETTTYRYDALGRLVAVATSGGAQDGRATSLCYDPAGNRAQYRSSAAGTLAACAAPPPPGTDPPPADPPPPDPPPSGNAAPTANPDALSAPPCAARSVNVVANDTDADGDFPLTLTAVSGPSATVENSSSVRLETPAANGSYVYAYTVADARGATANGTLTVTVGGTSQCA